MGSAATAPNYNLTTENDIDGFRVIDLLNHLYDTANTDSANLQYIGCSSLLEQTQLMLNRITA